MENIQDDMYTVRENVMYLLVFENFVGENPGGGDSGDNRDNDDDDESE